MSEDLEILQMEVSDVSKLLCAESHIGSTNVTSHMEQYVFKRRPDGVALINIRRTWEKVLLAARVIVTVPAYDVCAVATRPFAQRAVLKFAYYTGAASIAGRFTPGSFTNYSQKVFQEPQLIIVADPNHDQQAIIETSFVNCIVIAFCNTDSNLNLVDIAIPGNNKGKHSIGLLWWLLTREVLRLRGDISRETPWSVVPDLFFFREEEDIEKEEEDFRRKTIVPIRDEMPQVPPVDDWGMETIAQWVDNITPAQDWDDNISPTQVTNPSQLEQVFTTLQVYTPPPEVHTAPPQAYSPPSPPPGDGDWATEVQQWQDSNATNVGNQPLWTSNTNDWSSQANEWTSQANEWD